MVELQKLAGPQPAEEGQCWAGHASLASFVPSMMITLSHSLAPVVHSVNLDVFHLGVDYGGGDYDEDV